MQITNATVERAYKPDDYGTRRVVLTLNIDPGDDPNMVLGHVASLAETHARSTPQALQQPVEAAVVPPTLPGRGKRTAKDAVTPPAAAAPSSASAEIVPQSVMPAIAEVLPPVPTVAAPPPAAPASVVPVMSIAALPGASPSPAIDPCLTDQALSQLCGQIVNKHPQGTSERQATVSALTVLRSEYTGNPALTVAAIPMERRAEFHQRLSTL